MHVFVNSIHIYIAIFSLSLHLVVYLSYVDNRSTSFALVGSDGNIIVRESKNFFVCVKVQQKNSSIMSLPRYPQFSTTSSRNSATNQTQTPTQIQSNLLKNVRKTPNTSNIPVPATATKGYSSRSNNNSTSYRSKNDQFTEEDYGDDANLSREDCIVLLQPRMQPQGQENLSGNVTPTNPINDQGESITINFSMSCELTQSILFRSYNLRANESSDNQVEIYERCHRLTHEHYTLQSRQQSQLDEYPISRIESKLHGSFESFVFGRFAVIVQYFNHPRQ